MRFLWVLSDVVRIDILVGGFGWVVLMLGLGSGNPFACVTQCIGAGRAQAESATPPVRCRA